MGRKYRNPPIDEALCEFRFKSSRDWDVTVPGRVYCELGKERYPGIQQVKQSLVRTSKFHVAELTERVRFLREDDKSVIQVGCNMLSVHRLRPYVSWDHFKPYVEEGLNAYREAASPQGIAQIVLRYVNAFDIDCTTKTISDYLNIEPSYTAELIPHYLGGFNVGLQTDCENGRDVLWIMLETIGQRKPDTNGIKLDIRYSPKEADDISMDDVSSWIETAHTHIETAFEACLTDKTRESFQ